MKKALLLIFVMLTVSIVACQQAVLKEVPVTKVETTGEAVVDAVGDGLNNVDSVDKDLSAKQLGDLDSGLADVQNI